jgi:tRNA nucleotidyltransferase (CCA-adding enzyme)
MKNPIIDLKSFDIPTVVVDIAESLEEAGFEAYAVGGCIRDLFIGREPNDWDLTTNATPEQIQGLFEETFYENDFGTVGVVTESENPQLKVIEITPYRVESEYTDKRRPDSVEFSKDIHDDLMRRDFTINALALNVRTGEFIDSFGGIDDLHKKHISTVGKPVDRFNEDGLRILRAVRIAAVLGFDIEPETKKAIKDNVHLLEHVSVERIRDEFNKIVQSDNPMEGVAMCQHLGLLSYMIPELEEGIGIEQTPNHAFDVWTHLLKSMQHAADKKYQFHVRLAALFHDVGKPPTRRFSKGKDKYTFYSHEVVGARIAKKVLKRMKYSREIIEKVTKLVRWHMFFSDTDQITHSAVRRMVSNVGKEMVWDLMDVRVCDRIGTGRPKENPYRLRKYRSMVEEVMRDPVSVGMLKTDGKHIMDVTQETPGPKIGYILHALLEEVLDDPLLNTEEYLDKRTLELIKLDVEELVELSERGKEKKEEEEEKEIKKIHTKHRVQ